MNNKVTFIFIFTTGRTGTAMLAQIFGLEKYNKQKLYFTDSNRNVVAHECWDDIPVDLIKNTKFGSTEYIKICDNYLVKKHKEILSKSKSIQNIFITDHKLGRYFSDYLVSNIKFDYKIILLRRNKEDVVASFLEKMAKVKNRSTKSQYVYFQKRLWKNSFYSPFDMSALYPVDPIDWAIQDEEERINWYFDEVKRQWNRLSNIIPIDKRLEVKFENIIGGSERDLNGEIIQNSELYKISKFINLPYKKAFLDRKVNAR